MRKIYFDTSAYVKIFNQEPGSDLASSLFELAHEKRVKILMSIWTVNETFAAIDRLNRRKEISDVQRDIIFATLIQHTLDFTSDGSAIQFIPTDRQLVHNSKDGIVKYHISADDGLHLYTGYSMDCEYFIYRDDKLKRQTNGVFEGMPLLDITDHKDMNPLMKSFG